MQAGKEKKNHDWQGAARDYLRTNKVPYEVQHHPVAYTAQEIAERGHVSGKTLAKVVIVLADGNLVLLALPAPCTVDLDKVMLEAKEVRLAHEDEFAAAFPGCEVGAMPPLGNLYGLPAYVDQTLAEHETIVFQAGTHADTISIKYADFGRLARPNVADFQMESID